MRKIKLFGFTLNEVMIVLAVLGIVAILTVPTLQTNIQTRKWNAVSQDFVREFEESLKIMNLKKVLSGHTTTKSFVSKLSEYMRIVKICNNDELLECFSDKVTWGLGEATPEEIDMTKVKKAKHFGIDDWKSELIGVQFDNGINALVAYNPECSTNHLSNDNNLLDCVAVLYDVSGFAFPNVGGKDVRSYGVISSLGGAACMLEIDGACYGSLFVANTPHLWNACKSSFTSTDSADVEYMQKYGLNYCYPGNDYFAKAAEICGGTSKMPQGDDLAALANLIYGITVIGKTTDKSNIAVSLDPTTLGLPAIPFWIWSGEESTTAKNHSNARYFTSNYTYWDISGRNSNVGYVICLID